MENQLPPEILWKMISGMSAIIAFMFVSGVSVFVFFHKQILRRLDMIELDLRPINTKIALLDQHIEDILKRLENHDRRIGDIEKKR
jgi:hypothetical protein